MKTLLPLLLIFASNTALASDFDCADLVGRWVTDKFEYSINAQKRSETSYSNDGKFRSVFTLSRGDRTMKQVETGTWTCSGDFVTKNTLIVDGKPVEYSDVYQNIELTATYRKYVTVLMDCDVVIGDCKGKVYEATKE
jgi:hypothetical protein